MTASPNPVPRRDMRGVSLSTAQAATAPASLGASGVFCFIGTAADHLDRVERQLERQRASHGVVADLVKRQRILKARCAALGGRHE